jgi:hypothetical protein
MSRVNKDKCTQSAAFRTWLNRSGAYCLSSGASAVVLETNMAGLLLPYDLGLRQAKVDDRDCDREIQRRGI